MQIMGSATEYEVQGLYDGAWECVTTEDTRTEALYRVREYRVNDPGVCFRIRAVVSAR